MRLLLTGMTESEARRLREGLPDFIEDAGLVSDWLTLEDVVSKARPDVVAVYLSDRPGQILGLVRRVRVMFPATAYIAIADDSNPTLVQTVTESGCADLVLLRECPRELKRALEILYRRDKPADADGSISVILGSKGGVGTTVVAANIAAELASRGKERVILVDLNVYLGDAAVVLDLRPRPSVLWFLHRGALADARTWAEAPPMHRAGFRVLGLDGDVANVDPVSAEQVIFLCERLRERYEHVVIDAGSAITEISLAACTAATRRLVVFTDELAARTGALRRREAIKSMDLGPTGAKAILNRAVDPTPEYLHSLETALGMQVVGSVSNAWQEVQTALERGQVLRQSAPRSQIARDFVNVVDNIAGARQEEERRKRNFFSFFR
jgi:pilus assembly protein CpaE